MKKRIMTALLASAMILSVAGCGENKTPAGTTTAAPQGGDATTTAAPQGGDATTTAAPEGGDTATVDVPDDGKVLNIWAWNTEFMDRVSAFYPGYEAVGEATKDDDGNVRSAEGKIGDVKVVWTINPNANNGYQIPLDEALLDQDNKPADEKIDIFLIEADYADKYVNSDTSLPVSAVGITDADCEQMYQYTKDIATDANGNLKAVTWQATPGLFAYKRSIAKEVLGTDDPDEVQKAVADWDKFNETAAKMKEAGYYMLAGRQDSYRTFSNNVSAPWVNANDEIIIDANIEKWVEQTKDFTEKCYLQNDTAHDLWQSGWATEQSEAGKTFGFFYSTWGINFTLAGNAGEDGFGNWAVCYGPQSYYWGGTWICAAYQTDNKSLVKDIMFQLTCNGDIMGNITRETQDYTNNMAAMEAIAASDFKSDFLGGQNHIALFTENAKKIDMSNVSAYDQGLNEGFQEAMGPYFLGEKTYEECLDFFYSNAIVKYPNLKKPQ